jgi:AcrR family transcriptional regulator
MSSTSRRPAAHRMIYQTEPTRRRIVEAALALFSARGFADSQMKDVALAAGMSRTSLYRYFQDKLALSLVIVERMLALILGAGGRGGGAADGARTGLARIERHILSRWLSPRFGREYAFLAEFDAAYSGRGIPRSFAARLRRALRGYSDAELMELIRAGIRDGSVRPDLDPHLAMVTLLNAVRGLQQRLLLRGRALIEARRDELGKMSAEHLRYLIDGLRPRARRRKEKP